MFKTFRSHVTELPTTTSASEPFFPPFVPERERGRGRRPPPPPQQPTTEATTESDIPTTQPTTEATTESDIPTTQSVTEESRDVTTQDSAEQSTAGEMTDQITEVVSEKDKDVTIKPIVIQPESDESDTDYKEFMPGEIPDYSSSDYNDFIPHGNKR